MTDRAFLRDRADAPRPATDEQVKAILDDQLTRMDGVFRKMDAPRLAEAAQRVLADHDERVRIWGNIERTPNRVVVMEALRAALHAERESPIQAQSIVVSAKLDGIATLMRNLMGHIERAALVHDDRFVAAMRETVQEIWRELEDMGARVSR